MASFEGNASFVETKEPGEFKLVPKETGKWNATNIKQGLSTLIAAKGKLSVWSIWLDLGAGNPKVDLERKNYSAQELFAYLKMADNVELVMTKKKWPQLKVKLTKGAGSARTSSAGRREI